MSMLSATVTTPNANAAQRQSLIEDWLKTLFENRSFKLNYLAGDASFRRYARVQADEEPTCYMLMDAPPEKENCTPFVQIDEFLANNAVRVPKIIAQDLQHGLLLLEDFGDEVLANVLDAETVQHYYSQAFEQLIQLQAIEPDTTIIPPYSEQKLMQEMRLFDEWLLPSLNIEIDEKIAQLLTDGYQVILKNILAQPQVIVHRDFHSRNLMILADETALGIIDFQDAVIGADSYDLMSIIRDAYVQWSPQLVEQWIAQFYQSLPDRQKQQRTLAQFRLDCEMMAIQRHLKILGIFVRLFERDGKAGYLKDLPRVMYYLRQQLPRVPQLADVHQWLEQQVVPLFVQKYGDYVSVEAERG